MDVAVAVSGYVSKIASAGDGAANSKMKILLLDSETVCSVSASTERGLTKSAPGLNCIYGHHSVRPP